MFMSSRVFLVHVSRLSSTPEVPSLPGSPNRRFVSVRLLLCELLQPIVWTLWNSVLLWIAWPTVDSLVSMSPFVCLGLVGCQILKREFLKKHAFP